MAMAYRFFGFVIGGSLPVALAANWLAGAWDQNSAFFNATPATAALEKVALSWLLEIFGLPSSSAGAFVTGTTVAHITALAAARHAVLERAGWNVEADGLFGAPPITVVVGEEAHPTLFKALGVIGLGRTRVVRVPVDAQGRMRPDALPRLSGPAIVCTQAGNVNTGACDPHREIIEHAHRAGAWVHVDGALDSGLPLSSLAYLIDGTQEANSWATDAHKWLNVPYDSGLAFVRDRNSYERPCGHRRVPATSRRKAQSADLRLSSPGGLGRGVWAALRSLGRSGLAELIDRTCRMPVALQRGYRQPATRC
jgi:glutamate/tyrosine decarboxylase-like PLP-dependent enzyme